MCQGYTFFFIRPLCFCFHFRPCSRFPSQMFFSERVQIYGGSNSKVSSNFKWINYCLREFNQRFFFQIKAFLPYIPTMEPRGLWIMGTTGRYCVFWLASFSTLEGDVGWGGRGRSVVSWIREFFPGSGLPVRWEKGTFPTGGERLPSLLVVPKKMSVDFKLRKPQCKLCLKALVFASSYRLRENLN